MDDTGTLDSLLDCERQRHLIIVKMNHPTCEMVDITDPRHAREMEAFREHDECIAEYFGKVREHLFSYRPDRAYQDTYTGFNESRAAWEEMARRGSPNAKLLFELLGEGVELMPTEDNDLLVRYGALLEKKKALGADASQDVFGRLAAMLSLSAQSAQLIRERDRHIAKSIDSTLLPGETGVLFIGASHDVEVSLAGMGAPDVSVAYPAFAETHLARLETIYREASRRMRQDG